MTAPSDIAVIGIGCRFPDADSGRAFYRNLVAGKDSVTEIPSERWGHHGLYSADGEKNTISSKWGGFIAGLDEFDARFFKILPSEAEGMDPQQKLFLTCSWEALEDGGYSRRKQIAGRPIGVYAGVTWNEFSLLANEYGYLQDRYRSAGSLYWGIPNRVSYHFDFTGPSVAVDSACSSSLLAVHLASQSLQTGECEMALAGGVNLNLHPAKYLFLSSASFLSKEGKCRGFGEGGSGYVPSEGVGVVLLKRMSDALAAGDRIYGCIKATATNHGGKATGYTVPNPRAHKELIQTALKRAGVSAREVGYIECHGTGTDLGDPVEVAGLRAAFEESTADRGFCGIGTVKSNIGHTEAAAGVAGMIKVLHSMQEGLLPPTLHAEVPNRKIDFANSPFYLVQQGQAWRSEKPLLAGLSSFGAGGSNAHCILQSHAPNVLPQERGEVQLVPVSARTAESALAYCQELLGHLRAQPEPLDGVVRTLRRREEFEHRLVFAASSLPELLEALACHVAGDPLTLPGPLAEKAARWIARQGSFDEWPAPAPGPLVGLPTYRFEKTRSWLTDSRFLYQRPRFTRPLHPLVDANASTAKRGVFTKALGRDEYFVDEHFVAGEPVLPGVCHLEMVSFAASRYLQTSALRLSDVWFLEPIAVRGSEPVSIEAVITAGEDGHRYEVLTGGSVIHSTGKLRALAADTPAPRIDLGELRARCASVVAPDDFYALFSEKGIVQKGRFRVVSDFRYNATEAIGRLELSKTFAADAGYGFNPTLLDGAVQVAMIHLHRNLHLGTVLPYQIGSFVRRGETPATAFVVAKLKSTSSRRYDVFITDEAGQILVELEDFVLKEYRARQAQSRPLLFSTAMTVSAPAPAAEAPKVVCWLGDPVSRLPASWTRIDWAVAAPVPEAALAAWLQQSEGGGELPRIIVPVQAPAGELSGRSYPAIAGQADRLLEGLQALAKPGRALEIVVCLSGEAPASRAYASACAALLRTLNLELGKLRVRLVEIGSEAGTPAWLDYLEAELARTDAAVHVIHRAGERLVPQPERLELTGPVMEQDAGAWLVTGATGALGSQVALHLLRRGGKVVLLGRRRPDEATLSALREFPASRWELVSADLRIEADVAAAVVRAVERFGRVFSLVHCAGIVEDGAFLQKQWASFERVLATKLSSLLTLCDALACHQLQRVLLFSSITSQLGNRGQADYAFANGFLDGLAGVAGQKLPGNPAVTAVNWPYWAEGGMKLPDEKLAAYAESSLTQPLPTAVGMEILDQLLWAPPVRAALLYTTAEMADVSERLALKPLPKPPAPPAPVASTGEGLETPARGKGLLTPEEKKAAIQRYLVQFLETELKLTFTPDDLETNFSELGVDSIAQMDLIAKLEERNRFPKLPQSMLEDHKTLAALTEFFWDQHKNADYSLS